MSNVGKLILVSNRLPLTIVKRGNNFRLQRSTGGLAIALATIHKVFDAIWIGWPGIASEKIEEKTWRMVEDKFREEGLVPVLINETLMDKYYNGFANKTLWPLFHYFPQYAVFDESL